MPSGRMTDFRLNKKGAMSICYPSSLAVVQVQFYEIVSYVVSFEYFSKSRKAEISKKPKEYE